jgi:hypothetical protein
MGARTGLANAMARTGGRSPSAAIPGWAAAERTRTS